MSKNSSIYRFIKICGLTSVEDAHEAVILGADLLGLVMHPKSPRFCKKEDAAKIIQKFDFKPTVLVFADNEIGYASDLICELAGNLTYIQAPCQSALFTWLTENFPEEKVIPVYSIQEKTGSSDVANAMNTLKNHPWIILDTGGVVSQGGEKLYGGTGKTFDWNLVRNINRKYFLAGGLNPENISEAINVTNAPGYDVSSGIESSPGKKDYTKMQILISEIKNMGAIKSRID